MNKSYKKRYNLLQKIKTIYSGIKSFLYKHRINLTAFVSILSLIIAYYVIPQNNYLNELWIGTTNARISASREVSLCESYKNVSEDEKLQKGFYDSLIEYKKLWEQDLRKLNGISDQERKQGRQIHENLEKFVSWNWEQIDYINRYRSCPTNLLSDTQLKYFEEVTLKPFPKTFKEYIIFYLNMIFLWNFKGSIEEKMENKTPPHESQGGNI